MAEWWLGPTTPNQCGQIPGYTIWSFILRDGYMQGRHIHNFLYIWSCIPFLAVGPGCRDLWWWLHNEWELPLRYLSDEWVPAPHLHLCCSSTGTPSMNATCKYRNRKRERERESEKATQRLTIVYYDQRKLCHTTKHDLRIPHVQNIINVHVPCQKYKHWRRYICTQCFMYQYTNINV